MKTKTLIFFFLLLPYLVSSQLTFYPEHPQKGETVKFVYNPKDGPLKNASLVRAEALYFDYKSSSTNKSIPLVIEKDGAQWKGQFVLKTEEMVGILIVFNDSTGTITDNNKDGGYVVFVHDSEKKPLKGSYVGQAGVVVYASRNPKFKLKRDNEVQIARYEKEFSLNPEIKSDKTIIYGYLNALAISKREGYKTIIEKELDERIAKNEKENISELTVAVPLYERIGQSEKAEKYAKIIRDKEPTGMFVQTESMMKIMKQEDPQTKIALFEAFKKDFPSSFMLESLTTSMINVYINFYIEKDDLPKLKELVIKKEKEPKPINAAFFNSLAWKMAEKNWQLKTAEIYSAKSLEMVSNDSDFKSSRAKNNVTNTYRDTYGVILEKQGRMEEAYTTYKSRIVEDLGDSNPEVNERFILAAQKTGHIDEVKTYGEMYIKAGKATEKIKTTLKDLYIKASGASSADAYIIDLEKDAKAKSKESTLNKMISEIAPVFTLKDLSGNTISLSDLKGKIVIIDFWATWCGPCIQSFPGMLKAQEKYKNNPNVQFLFVNTWEKTDDFLSKVKDFVIKKKYENFTVPVDADNKVVASYKVEGIPTKFIIDQNGMIRFKSIGYYGSTEGVVTEVSNMIEAVMNEVK